MATTLNNKLSRIFYLSILAITLSGYATVFSGTTQTINVKAVDSIKHEALNNVSCIVTDGEGAEYPLISNPGVVTVKRGNGSLIITCKKEGYRQLNIAVGDNFNAVSVVNVLFWPGFIIDGLSGAYKKYPSHYIVLMEMIMR